MARVLLDARVIGGGVGRYARDLVAALATVAHGPTVLTRDPSPLSPPFTPWGRLGTARRARRARADLIHGLHLEVPATSIPCVVTIHDLIPLNQPDSMPSSMKRREWDRLLRAALRRARAVIVPSARSSDELKAYGAPMDKVHIVPHGVSDRFQRASDDDRIRARDRFAGGRRYVAALVSSRPHKNLSGLLTAAPEIERNADAVVVGFGEPVDGSAIRSLGSLHDDDLVELYAGAELVLLSSLAEGFGLPLLEALACGTPVVCGSDVGALAYIGDGAVVTDVADPAAMAAATVRLLGDPELRAQLGDAGYIAARRMTFADMGRATNNVYISALTGTV